MWIKCKNYSSAQLIPSTPADCCCSKSSVPYWSNPLFLIFDIRALWRSVLSARAPECQKLKMVSKTCIAKGKVLMGSAVKGLRNDSFELYLVLTSCVTDFPCEGCTARARARATHLARKMITSIRVLRFLHPQQTLQMQGKLLAYEMTYCFPTTNKVRWLSERFAIQAVPF